MLLRSSAISASTTCTLANESADQRVDAITPLGKHMMIDLAGGWTIRVHLGMNGRVRRYTRDDGEAMLARMSPGRATIAIVTANMVAVWINAKTVEVAGAQLFVEAYPARPRLVVVGAVVGGRSL